MSLMSKHPQVLAPPVYCESKNSPSVVAPMMCCDVTHTAKQISGQGIQTWMEMLSHLSNFWPTDGMVYVSPIISSHTKNERQTEGNPTSHTPSAALHVCTVNWTQSISITKRQAKPIHALRNLLFLTRTNRTVPTPTPKASLSWPAFQFFIWPDFLLTASLHLAPVPQYWKLLVTDPNQTRGAKRTLMVI